MLAKQSDRLVIRQTAILRTEDTLPPCIDRQ